MKTQDRVKKSEVLTQDLKSVSVNDDYLVVDISMKPKNFDGEVSEKICFDRVRFSAREKVITVTVPSQNFKCPEVLDSLSEVRTSKLSGQPDDIKVEVSGHRYVLLDSKGLLQDDRHIDQINLVGHGVVKKKFKGNKLYYALLPITIPFDIVTLPIQAGIFIYKMRQVNQKTQR